MVSEREIGQRGTQAGVNSTTACIPSADGRIPRIHTTIHLSRAPVKPFSSGRLECRDCRPICCLYRKPVFSANPVFGAAATAGPPASPPGATAQQRRAGMMTFHAQRVSCSQGRVGCRVLFEAREGNRRCYLVIQRHHAASDPHCCYVRDHASIWGALLSVPRRGR